VMAHLPPGGWPNLATKQDILLLRQELDRLRQEFGHLREEFGELRGPVLGEFERRLKAEIVGELKPYIFKTVLFANFGLAATFATIAFGAAGLT
jgi:hypothetical protein